MAFITVQDWMVKNFNLKGNELLAYAPDLWVFAGRGIRI